MIRPEHIVVRGAGDLGSAVAWALHCVGFRVTITEIACPLCVRRAVAFSDAIYDGTAQVEGVTGQHVERAEDIPAAHAQGCIALLIDPDASTALSTHPYGVIDAIMAKRNTGTHHDMAPLVIALGPGFRAGTDVDAVIETNRGHNLARIIWEGAAEPDTGSPAPVAGHARDRVLRAPAAGIIQWEHHIGDIVRAGEVLGHVAGIPLPAPFDGVLRGAIRGGLEVAEGLKIGDVDPRLNAESCFTISDKARAIAGSTLQALLMLARRLEE